MSLTSNLSIKKIFIGIILTIILLSCFTSIFIYFLYSRIQSTQIKSIYIQKKLYKNYINAYDNGQYTIKPADFEKTAALFEKNLSSLINGGKVISGINNDESIHVKPSSSPKLRKILFSIESEWNFIKDFIASKHNQSLTQDDKIMFIENTTSLQNKFDNVRNIYRIKFEQIFLNTLFLQIGVSLLVVIILIFLVLKKHSELSISNRKGILTDRFKKASKDRHRKDAAEINELHRSNKDLEAFAHIASHDLKEPLRMVTSYSELLYEKYNNKIDEKSNKYISYIVDGASRMQVLIEDLLSYSCVKTHEYNFELLNLTKILESVQNNLKLMIAESNATIKYGKLPEIQGDRIQFIQLLQNLLSNAIKYRRSDLNPIIEINAKRSGKNYLFSVKDNGIGIDSKFFDRIFLVFQRLHEKSQIDGSGIGLAIVMNIVEKHGGKIWVNSKLNEGSIFYFTIPANNVGKI